MRYQELIQIYSGGPAKLSLHKLVDVPPNSGDFHSALEDIMRSGERNFILDCDWHVVYIILHQVWPTREPVTVTCDAYDMIYEHLTEASLV